MNDTKKTVTFSLSVEIIDKINELCKVRRSSKSGVVEYSIEKIYSKETNHDND